MKIQAQTPQEYIQQLPDDRKLIMENLRKVIKENLPKGFEETISYGMITYVVPHQLYPKGYHCNPKQALPFISIASQKNFIAIYHMGLYAQPELLKWFSEQYSKQFKYKLDMGKSCLRFKKNEQIPYELIGEFCQKISPAQWIELYERQFIKK
ncbi:MAG: DUF1801 domain-containing protein [Bacteroidia bacterium]|nr:DUF1801 domain-containing protein [Bacteroidia bacterium]